MAGPLLNLHMANASPLILLSYYLLKSMFHLCYPRPNGGQGPGAALPRLLYHWCALSSAALKPGPYSFSGMVFPILLPLSVPLPTNPKVPLLSPCSAIGHRELYLPIRTR